MPFNGSGVFNRVYSWQADKAAGIDITASRTDTDTNDITSNGLSLCITRDGQGSATANQPMNGFRHTGASPGVSSSDYVTLSQITTAPISTTGSVTASSLNTGGALTAEFATLSTSGSTILWVNSSTAALTLNQSGPVASNGIVINLSNASTGLLVFAESSTVIGSITTNGTSTAFNTTSDYRLKTTYGPSDGSLIGDIQVHDAEFLKRPGECYPMVLAHELQAVAPWAVTGTKDAVDDEGAIVPQVVDVSKLVPAMIAKIQILEARIAELETR